MSITNLIIVDVIAGELEHYSEAERYEIWSNPQRRKEFIMRTLSNAGISLIENYSGNLEVEDVEIVEESSNFFVEAGKFLVDGLQEVFERGGDMFENIAENAEELIP